MFTKLKLLLLIFATYQTLFAYNCGYNRLPTTSPTSTLQTLANCSWVVDGTDYIVDVLVYYKNDFYSNMREKGKDNHINELVADIEKTVANNLYFTNWKYQDPGLKKPSAGRTVSIQVNIELYQYNEHTDLHYGIIEINISPDTLGIWHDKEGINAMRYLYNKEYAYRRPFAGYKDSDKILTQNIVNRISYFMNDSFRDEYKNVAKLLSGNKNILVSLKETGALDSGGIDGLSYLLRNHDINLSMSLNKEDAQMLHYFFPEKNTSDEEYGK